MKTRQSDADIQAPRRIHLAYGPLSSASDPQRATGPSGRRGPRSDASTSFTTSPVGLRRASFLCFKREAGFNHKLFRLLSVSILKSFIRIEDVEAEEGFAADDRTAEEKPARPGTPSELRPVWYLKRPSKALGAGEHEARKRLCSFHRRPAV